MVVKVGGLTKNSWREKIEWAGRGSKEGSAVKPYD
jgi:hypothetical protein